MDEFGTLIELVVNLFKIEFTIGTFTFSLWQVFLFDIAAGILAFIISEVFLSE